MRPQLRPVEGDGLERHASWLELFFDLIFVLTGGGPADATRVLALDMYKQGFQANLMGQASAIAVILVLIGLALALVLRRLGGRNQSASQLEGA